MKTYSQSPTAPEFVQNPYEFYDKTRETGPVFRWADYGDLMCLTSHKDVSAALKNRNMGREARADAVRPVPDRLKPFYDIEAHSMLELERPAHTRLRGLVLRAFTSRRIAGLADDIRQLSHQLLDEAPKGPFDLLATFAQPLPVIVIARLLGVPEEDRADLLAWSNAMVAMYLPHRSEAVETAAVAASIAFSQYLQDYIAHKTRHPADDLISTLIAAEQDGEKLSRDELISTCILLLNAGHEATVHSLGNATKALIENDHRRIDAATVEEALRFDAPLHMFTRWVYEDTEIAGELLPKGSQIGCLLGAANRDPAAYDTPHRFDPSRQGPAHTGFGAGIHFCVGAPLARLELMVGLETLFDRFPDLKIARPPQYRDLYHFHGLRALEVEQ